MYDAVLESSVEGTHEVCAETLECSFNKWKQCSENTTSVLEKQFEVTGKTQAAEKCLSSFNVVDVDLCHTTT